ncbi:aminopeptidase [Jeotgalibacillus aurantiacus]|uniref:aminopeptidase n=1 Tax=Jeotgalibacillus aurantiacus TaxID=2763266 RepID=UPI001D09A7EA|nr:aminopeptidase [Jeotgalibacillus aurantiacus]
MNELLLKYAKLAVRTGVNIQEGQFLWIAASVDSAAFTRLVVEEAYRAGAGNVHVQWHDDRVTRLFYEKALNEEFDYYPEWLTTAHEETVEREGAFLVIESDNPDLLKGISSDRIAAFAKARGEALGAFYEAIETDRISWSIVAVPSADWALKLFPENSEEEAVEKLWESIFSVTRILKDDPVLEWEHHMENLKEKASSLTERQYAALHYQGPGTDITIELPAQHKWLTGGSKNKKGYNFIANLPTEEVYTVPHRLGVNGYVTNTKPLAYQGNIIDGFTLTFKEGKVVDFKADVGQELLEKILTMDEGAPYLGEIALVPHRSPISDSGILFFNTLFDENASNHFALGSCYPTCIEGGTEMNDEERIEAGLNDSIVHEDFMMGSAQMNIDGIRSDGTREPVFRNGNWATE